MIVSKENPKYGFGYEKQIDFYDLKCNERTLQRALKRDTDKAQMYMRPRVKNIRRENKIKRNSYGKTHASETVDSLWQYVVFTDDSTTIQAKNDLSANCGNRAIDTPPIPCKKGLRSRALSFMDMRGSIGILKWPN